MTRSKKTHASQALPQSGLLTRQQVALYLGVSVNTVTALVKTGSIPKPLIFGKRIQRWREADLTTSKPGNR
jgi:excisionase family DNA binding protein